MSDEVVYGKHPVRAVFLARPEAVRRLLLLEGPIRYLQEFVNMAKAAGIEPEVVDRATIDRLGRLEPGEKHQGVLAITKPRVVRVESELGALADAKLVLVLDQVSNPQNFGAVLRGAAFFGADAVLWLKNRSADLTSTVVKVSVGGVEIVDLYRVTNLSRSLQTLKDLGFWVYGLDERGEHTLAETSFADRTALVIGAEGEGLRKRTKEHCDVLVRISGGRSGVESLNAAVAATVALAEVTRDQAFS